MWFTENGLSRIARITPTGTVTEFSAGITPGAEIGELVVGPDGNLWFPEGGGNRIGRITPAGVVREFVVGPPDVGAVFGVAAGPDGNIWFTHDSIPDEEDPDPVIESRIGRLVPATGAIAWFAVPAGDPRLQSLVTDIEAGGEVLWFSDTGNARLGRITTAGQITMLDRDGTERPGPPRVPALRLEAGLPQELAVTPDGTGVETETFVSPPGSGATPT